MARLAQFIPKILMRADAQPDPKNVLRIGIGVSMSTENAFWELMLKEIAKVCDVVLWPSEFIVYIICHYTHVLGSGECTDKRFRYISVCTGK